MCLDLYDWELKPLDDTTVVMNVVGDQGPVVLHIRDAGIRLAEPTLPATVKHLNEEWHEPALFVKAMLDAKINMFPGLRFVSDRLRLPAPYLRPLPPPGPSCGPRVVALF